MRDDLIYLDYNATTPVDPRVASVIFECMNEEFGNPSSTHVYGESAHAALERARSQIASLIGASTAEIVFTGSGSEADALAIRGAYLSARAESRSHSHMITQVTEHPAVLAAMPAIATSAGSACHAGRNEPSSVLLALGLDPVDALCAVRISIGRWSTEDEIDDAAVQILSTARVLTPSLKLLEI